MAQKNNNPPILGVLSWRLKMVDGPVTDVLDLLQACARGVMDAQRRFQGQFGELIYSYPMKKFRLPADRAGDFYIYVFEKDRIFKRASAFAARNGAQFETYLNYYLLRDLFFEWQRTQKNLETVSLESIVAGGWNDGDQTLDDVLAYPNPSHDQILNQTSDDAVAFRDLTEKLDPEACLLMKLLYLAEVDLSPAEIRRLCNKSGRSYREIIVNIEEIRSRLSKKDEELKAIDEQLESIYGWMLIYQKELNRLQQTLDGRAENSSDYQVKLREREDLERKLAWRYRQQSRAIEKRRQFRITTPYKDIAWLIKAPIGTVCSLVARARGTVAALVHDHVEATRLVAP